MIETTFAEKYPNGRLPASRPCFGGAVSTLIKAGFQTLVDAGYQRESACLKCMHEPTLIVDLMYRGGLNYKCYSISDTAEQGDYTAARASSPTSPGRR